MEGCQIKRLILVLISKSLNCKILQEIEHDFIGKYILFYILVKLNNSNSVITDQVTSIAFYNEILHVKSKSEIILNAF